MLWVCLFVCFWSDSGIAWIVYSLCSQGWENDFETLLLLPLLPSARVAGVHRNAGLCSTGDPTQGILHTRPVLYQLSYNVTSFCLRQGLTLYARLTSNFNLLPSPPRCWNYEHGPIAFFWLWFWVFSFHLWWLYRAQAVCAPWKS